MFLRLVSVGESQPDELLTYLHHIFPLSAGRRGFGSGGWLWGERWRRVGGGGKALTGGNGGRHWHLIGRGGGIVEEDPLAASPGPALVFAEASEPGAGGEVEAELSWRPRRGPWFGQRLAFGWLISFAGAGLVDATGCRGQQGELRGGAFAVKQRGELPQSQVRARVRPLTL